MEVVAVNQTVLSLSAPLHTRRLFIKGMCVYVSVWMHARMCVYVESLCGLCFSFTGGSVHLFVFLVLSPSCIGMVWWCTGRGRVVKQAPGCSDFCHSHSHFGTFLFLGFHFSLNCHSPLYTDSSIFFPFVCWILFISPCFLHCPLSLSLAFLHHKHFQPWHTRVDSHPENSATTIMSMLSSHNNTRITCWGRQALLWRDSQTWLHWTESVNTT